MNNSTIYKDNVFKEERDDALGKQQSQLIKTVEVIRRVSESDDWILLKKLVFDGVIEKLERQLKSEAQKDEVNAPELYRLQGQLVWARQYADLNKLAEVLKQQIEGIKLKLK